MSRFIIVGVLSMLMIFIFACSGEKKADAEMDQQADTQMEQEMDSTMATAVPDSGQAICPACNMVMEKTEMIEYVSGEDTIYFCSEGCQKHYLAQQEEPETEEE